MDDKCHNGWQLDEDSIDDDKLNIIASCDGFMFASQCMRVHHGSKVANGYGRVPRKYYSQHEHATLMAHNSM